jgi:hypothetical protein
MSESELVALALAFVALAVLLGSWWVARTVAQTVKAASEVIAGQRLADDVPPVVTEDELSRIWAANHPDEARANRAGQPSREEMEREAGEWEAYLEPFGALAERRKRMMEANSGNAD